MIFFISQLHHTLPTLNYIRYCHSKSPVFPVVTASRRLCDARAQLLRAAYRTGHTEEKGGGYVSRYVRIFFFSSFSLSLSSLGMPFLHARTKFTPPTTRG
ncbi:hypothetical protein PUN28_016283 [Cardiocondyla obscurior]|uniref:Uncharacterized protein n=1 Tax=Cardiocondyla obscurior TaxID=286306 RepID=A0AAW2EVE9_9HYME